MKEYFSTIEKKRKEIGKKIKKTLLDKREIIFAFLYGSFLDSPSYRDIDIGVYLNNIKENQVFDYELGLAEEIAKKCEIAFDVVDVKVLNSAPDSFLNSVFTRGDLLFSRCDDILLEMIEKKSLGAIENEYISYQSLKELIPS